MAEETNRNYEEIYRPYDSYLQRSVTVDESSDTTQSEADTTDSTTTNAGGTSGDNGSVESQPVKSSGAMGDLWITNVIRSTNWKPKKVGFYIDGQTGYAEFSDVYVGGTITADIAIIGGWTVNASSLSTANIVLDAGNQRIQVGAGSEIIIDGATQTIESSNYVSGVFGAGFHIDSNLLEVGNIAARGLIRSAVFQKDVVNVMGGNFAVLDGDVLDEDMTAWG